jgi:NAD(P)-dependent dehydrogenase (short-subunit alcohol dehydrogenase family)
MARILITGGAGFIGSTYVRVALAARPDDEVVVFDKLTYAGREENLADVRDRIEFVQGAIEDRTAVREAMDGADLVVNFAAESHVDRSIADQDAFAVTQVIGTGVLLDAVRETGVQRFVRLIARNGFFASFIVRLVPSAPFIVVNMAAGVTPMRALDFSLGTALGIIPKIALTAFAGGSIVRLLNGDVGREALRLALIVAVWIGLGWVARAWLRSREKEEA